VALSLAARIVQPFAGHDLRPSVRPPPVSTVGRANLQSLIDFSPFRYTDAARNATG